MANPDDLKAAQLSTAQAINRHAMMLLGLWMLSLVLLGFPDSYFLESTASASIPVVGATSFKLVLVVLPLLMLAVRVHLNVYIKHEAWVHGEFGKDKVDRVPIASPMSYPLMRSVRFFVVYLSVPTAFAAMTYKGMVYVGWGAALLAGTLLIVAVHVVSYLRSATFLSTIEKAALVLVIGIVFMGSAHETDEFRRPFQLEFADLSGTNLREQDLRGAHLYRANLQNADLSGAILVKANMHKALLSEADLQGADLSNALLDEATLDKANLKKANLSKARLRRTKLIYADLSEALLTDSYASWANFSNAILRVARLERAYLRNAKFTNARLEFADLTGTDLSGASLVKADLSVVTLSNAKLNSARLKGAFLYEASLTNVDFDLADLIGADFSFAIFANAKNLTQDQLNLACGEDTEALRPGLKLKPCEAKQ